MSSFCFSNDLLVVRWKQEVVEDGGALDEPMAKLLSVVRWPSVGSGNHIPVSERRRSGNSSGAVDGCDSGAAAVRRRTACSKWFWYGARRRRCRGGSSASASAAKSLRALRLRLHWTTTSGYRLRRDGGGRRWIGRYGVEDGGGWGFATGG